MSMCDSKCTIGERILANHQLEVSGYGRRYQCVLLVADTYVLEIRCTKRLYTLPCSWLESGSLQRNQQGTWSIQYQMRCPMPYSHSRNRSGQCHRRLSLL